MRKFIEKINNAIQWTKKFHFFHISFITPFIITILIILIAIPYSETINELFSCWIIVNFILLYIIPPIALIVEIVIMIIRKWTHKSIYVSKSIVENKYYNIVYILSILQLCFALTILLLIG